MSRQMALKKVLITHTWVNYGSAVCPLDDVCIRMISDPAISIFYVAFVSMKFRVGLAVDVHAGVCSIDICIVCVCVCVCVCVGVCVGVCVCV